jgi:5,10-methylenetetrahydromethanopterin reductase
MSAVEFTLGCVLRPGEDASSSRAKEQAGTLVAAMLHGLVETPELDRILGSLPPAIAQALTAYRKIYESYQPADARYLTLHRGHLMHLRPEEESLITGDLLRALAWVGTESELRERVRALETAGYTQIAIQVVEGHEDAIEDWARVFGLSDRRARAAG